MILTLNLSGETPIYQQIRGQIIAAIAKGGLRPGDPLPSVRQMAVDIGVNMHTVNKAYALLREDGYLIVDRRSGARVADRLDLDGGVVERVRESVGSAALEAQSRGMGRNDFLALCADCFDGLPREGST